MRVNEWVDRIFERPDDQGVSLGMVVVHRGEIIAERYGTQPESIFAPAMTITAETTLSSWSTAKSMTHAVVGILVRDGLIDVSEPAAIPEWAETDKEQITLLDLLEMRSGLRFVEDYVDGETSHCIAMLFGGDVHDYGSYAAGLPLDHPPGTFWNYSSGTTNIITSILGDVIGGGEAGMTSFLNERLFGPIGMASAVPKFDPAGTWVGSSYVCANTRDFAAFGELYRNNGVTSDGVRILPERWAEHGRTFVAHDQAEPILGGFDYGRHWWMWPEFPDSMAAHGYEGQYIVVVPDRELTVAHLGKTDSAVRHYLVEMVHGLIRDVPPSA